MTDHPVRSRRWKLRGAHSRAWSGKTAASVLLCALLVAGCAERKRPTLPWQTASIVHPRLPAPAKSVEVADQEEPPELRIALPAPLVDFPLGANPRPARPRAATPPPPAAEPSKPQTPFVAPQLSAEESSTAQQETTASLMAAERSLSATQGKSLNAAQSDMASKISGFMADARAAG